MSEEGPKIFIDEDWKQQVQREKEQAKQQAAAQPAPEQAAQPEAQAAPQATPQIEPTPEEAMHGPAGEMSEEEQTPFIQLVASLTTQSLLALGVLAPQGSREVPINLDQAQYTIDMLRMLEEKTKGNLSPIEQTHLTEVLAELEHIYAARMQQFNEQTIRQAGIDPMNLKDPGQ